MIKKLKARPAWDDHEWRPRPSRRPITEKDRIMRRYREMKPPNVSKLARELLDEAGIRRDDPTYPTKLANLIRKIFRWISPKPKPGKRRKTKARRRV